MKKNELDGVQVKEVIDFTHVMLQEGQFDASRHKMTSIVDCRAFDSGDA